MNQALIQRAKVIKIEETSFCQDRYQTPGSEKAQLLQFDRRETSYGFVLEQF